MKNIWFRAIFISIFCALLSFFVYKLGGFQYLENKSYDRRMVSTGKYFKSSDEIIFIGVDQESLDWARENKGWSWPWPREAYGNIIDFLSAGNVNSIMLDMFYTEPSVYGIKDDMAFATAQEKSGKVIQSVFVQENGKVLLPIEPLKKSSGLIANVTSVMDKDDVIRRYKPFSKINGINYPSLGMAPILLETNKNMEEFDFPPMRKDGTVRLRYKKSINEYHPYRAGDILESYDNLKAGKKSIYVPEDFQGTYVFFALYAPGLFDICSTPVSQVYPGVGVHITALDNYLQKNFIYDVPGFIEFLWFFAISLLGGFIVAIGESRKKQWKIILIIDVGFVLGSIIAFGVPFILFIYGINMPLVCAFFSYLLTFGLMFGLIYLMEGNQKRFIKSAFSQCLSKDVVNEIINNPSSFTLGGKKINMTAIFTDIEKFSSLSELLTASQLGTLLNYYLTKMSDIIINERGTVDKYEGDAIVAMVGAPVEMKDHGARAARAAIKMKKQESLMNEEIKNVVAGKTPVPEGNQELFSAFNIMVQNGKRLFTRIGINSGEMIAGYFGSTLKKNYTIMGNNVNLASRLEGVNKLYSTGGILISQFTRNEIGDDFIVRTLDKVQVVNVDTPIELFELLEERVLADEKLINYVENWEKAMDDFKSGSYKEALNKFKNLKEQNKSDKVPDYYINIIEKYFIKGIYPTEMDNMGAVYNPKLKVFRLLQK